MQDASTDPAAFTQAEGAIGLTNKESVDQRLSDVIARIAAVAVGLARRIARGGLEEDLGAAQGDNAAGDGQKALDIIACEAFRAALHGSALRFYASEECDQALELNPGGDLALAIDPLDGSSNIGVNISIGTIFGIFPAEATPEASFLRPGRALLAAGYVIYGPQCCLVVTRGAGVEHWLLDPQSGAFRRLGDLHLPQISSEFAINASNYRHWDQAVRAYVDDCVAGTEGPKGRDFNMRWIASLVAETHRILVRGGVFLYPADRRRGYEAGRLRYLYEAAPIAFLMEQAGGAASDGRDAILDLAPRALHGRIPLVFGCRGNVARVAAYHDLPHHEAAALFGRRGLFRS